MLKPLIKSFRIIYNTKILNKKSCKQDWRTLPLGKYNSIIQYYRFN
jgi:hypothetical protein